MYYRIKNQLDAGILAEEILETNAFPKLIADRVTELTNILDDAYGADRGAYAMGGYVFIFPSEENYEKNVSRILDFHHMEFEGYEYSDDIGETVLEDGRYWKEELYLLGSDDGLVLIHPKEVANV